MLVVADTSSLVALAAAESLDLLDQSAGIHMSAPLVANALRLAGE